MADNTEYFFNGHKVSKEQMEALIEASQGMYQAQEKEVADNYGVSDETASAIVYLRSRSRWTQRKETHLVDRDLAGDPIPLSTVLRGEF